MNIIATQKRRSDSNECNGEDKKQRLSEELLIPLKGCHADRKGEREEMQDAHVILDDFRQDFVSNSNEIRRLAYYAVFDGHAGARASRFAAENLHKNWATTISPNTSLSALEQNLKRCFIEAYKKTDDQFLGQAVKVKPVWKDGTTATALFVVNNAVFVTNLGDSRAVLCRYKPDEKKEIPVILTRDHNPSVFEERMRIQKAGGNVKDGRIMGVLEVSRSIGDGQYKNYGVTCVPDVKKCTLTANDRYILIGCDGLWKAFNNQDALKFIHEARDEIWKSGKVIAAEDKSLSDVRWETVCQRLAAEAVRKGSGDNVTVVLIVVGDSDKSEFT